MALYIFERAIGTLDTNKVKEILRRAGEDVGHPDDYDPADYTYTEINSKSVSADGPGSMAVNKLEKAATELGFKKVTVTHLDADAKVSEKTMARVPRTADNPLGATSYGVTIIMPQATVEALSTGTYSLYAFKAVQTNAGGGVPLVWFKSDDFGLNTDVSWEIQYQAYTSRSQIVPNGQITGLSSYAADLGQKLEVQTPQGTGNVVAGTEGNISIENLTSSPMTCGISEVVGGIAEPLCAFPLYGNGLDAMVPIQKVMLTFSTKTVNTGTVIEKAYSQSILIDLTSATHREVAFDINEGWSWGGFSWGAAIRPSTNVVPILIEGGDSFKSHAITMLG
ncbi:MAG: hypothetical protein Q7N95_16525 [Alphaproteobacteria bacterium]|nr:hypothetical protein [Alphaproteobacteria bacterium]